MNTHNSSHIKIKPLLGILTLLTLVAAFYRTAWVAEDAFITFRVIDNTLNGFGLVWNVGERVQVFTHPAWFGLLLPFVWISGDPYFSALLLSFIFLIITFAVIWRMQQDRPWFSIIAIASLLWSRAFIDYSSSGLENPMTHALTAIFIYLWIWNRRTVFLFLVTSALFLTRPDAIIIVIPALLTHLYSERQWRQAVVGILPAVLWVLFSLFYYGAPVPNTALAKVATALPFQDRAQQAINYIIWTLKNDPVTLFVIFLGIISGYTDKHYRQFSSGLILFLIYLFYVGADYMQGRFFSAPVLLSVIIISITSSRIIVSFVLLLLLINIKILGLTLFSPASFNDYRIMDSGIADERGFYYQQLGLSSSVRLGTWKSHGWLKEGQVPPGLYTRCTIGMAAYGGGPSIRWVDPLALTEPFLSRLPARQGSRVGHYERALPNGYLDSMLAGENRIVDPALHSLYADVDLAVRAPLLSPGRLGAIWRLNTGFHRNAASAFDRNAIGLPKVPVLNPSAICYGLPPSAPRTWKIEGPPATARMVLFMATPKEEE